MAPIMYRSGYGDETRFVFSCLFFKKENKTKIPANADYFQCSAFYYHTVPNFGSCALFLRSPTSFIEGSSLVDQHSAFCHIIPVTRRQITKTQKSGAL